jgi:hypothetical protein
LINHLGHAGRMDEDQLYFHPANPSSEDRIPTRLRLLTAAMLGMIGGAVAALTLIEAFSRSCL